MSILLILAGCVAFVICGNEDGDKIIKEEADNFALWLTDRVSRAQVEECRFKLSMSQHDTKNASFRMLWQGGTQSGATETYQTSRVRIFPANGDLSKPMIFDGEWGSFTPALTLAVNPLPRHKGRSLFVVVSGVGYVSVRDKI